MGLSSVTVAPGLAGWRYGVASRAQSRPAILAGPGPAALYASTTALTSQPIGERSASAGELRDAVAHGDGLGGLTCRGARRLMPSGLYTQRSFVAAQSFEHGHGWPVR